ncbi:TonB-dependent receptor [Prevotella copri]|uniref:TonB-dependent receptor n=1 Tax=Segatella copri TaxID=165179 RepID=UPI00222FA0D9|nr:TonB-dependent receptor [Segatella copri]MCW4119713.1 TonB-dependent receptor [Segatella copri]
MNLKRISVSFFSLLLASQMTISAQNVSFSTNKVTLKSAFEKIEKASKYKIAYNSSQLNANRSVTLSKKSDDVFGMLTQLLKETNCTYELEGNYIIIKPLQKAQTSGKKVKVRGVIKDETGEPIIGATVRVKGQSEGTVSDFDGNFTLDVTDDNTLQISYIGYQTQEFAVGKQHHFSIVLEEDKKILNEVVVIGYGTQKKGDITSSVGSVKSEDFTAGAINDAGQLIQGKIAGLSVTNPSGNPVGGTEISLRGNTTILGASTNPLILIDGVPGDFNTVAPEDIESIDVLKDGSAAAIYGSRGTNGVVLITTKKSKGNNINEVQYSGYLSLSTIAKKPDFCDADDYRQQIKDGLRDAAWDLGDNTNWIDAITRTGLSHVHNISFKGGNAQTNYIFNVNYRNLQGIFKRSDKEEFQGRAEVNHSMFDDKLRFNFQLLGNQTGYTATSDGGSFNTYSWRQALIHNPTEPIKNADGSWHENTGIFNYDNPVSRIYECDGEQKISQTRFSSNITLTPIKELTFNALFSYDKINQEGGYYETKKHISNVRDGMNGYASTGGSSTVTKLVELTAQFHKNFGDHTIQALAGYSYQESTYSNQYERNYNFPTDLYSWHNIGVGQALKEGLGTEYSYWLDTNLIGFFGRLNYNYKNRYLLMASVRHEAASQLAGTNKPWGTFPSVSLGWRITEEKFMKNQKVFDDIKLRAGYGVTGSQPSQSFLGVPLLGYGDYYLYNGQWIRALQPTQNSNDKLKWEEKHEYDIGADFSILNYRLNVSVDWYYRLIKGLLYDYSVPSPPNLYTTTRANVGEMSNNGLEIMVNAIPVQTKDFKWETTITFSTNSNKLKSLSNDLYQTSSDYFMTGWIEEPIKTESHIVRIGHKVGDIYGFKVVDVDESGKWIYLDKNGNRVNYDEFTHSFEDKQILGNGVPKWYLGFNNQFRYKNFDLAINMRGAFGFQIMNGMRMFYENRSRQDWNRLRSAYDKVFGKAVLNTLCSEEFNSYYVENGDYWKIDNITLGYSFSKINKWIKTLRLYASVNNAITITGYKGIDPEVSTSGLAPSYDNRDSYPHTRAFTFGMNVTF